MAVCNTEELLALGKCFSCLDQKQMQIVEIQLLCEILNATTGGGSGSVLRGDDADPNGIVTATGAAFYRATNGNTWFHDTAATSNTDWVALTLV